MVDTTSEVKHFYENDLLNHKVTFAGLITHVNSSESICINPVSTDTGKLFMDFIKALAHDLPFVFLDQNFSNEELKQLEEKPYAPILQDANPSAVIGTSKELVQRIKSSKSQITLYTSGTTGQPKKVIHSITTLTREIRETNDDSIQWGLAYNPTHMAGLQVFFQAFYNRNTIVDLFNQPKSEIIKSIQKNKVTHLSATPTFFRLILEKHFEFLNVKRISIGGERSDPNLIKRIMKSFPNAKINNIYASTEAGALFASKAEGFSIPEYRTEYIKFVNNEIFIHKKLISASIKISGDWYPTGDLIEWIDQEKQVFKIIGRKNELLNVGGMKVNPAEVESKILSFPGVNNTIVYGKENSVIGTIICADITVSNPSQFNQIEFKQYLHQSLQKHKVPRKISVVDSIKLSRTGKIKRY